MWWYIFDPINPKALESKIIDLDRWLLLILLCYLQIFYVIYNWYKYIFGPINVSAPLKNFLDY